jgi:hypothetical protein
MYVTIKKEYFLYQICIVQMKQKFTNKSNYLLYFLALKHYSKESFKQNFDTVFQILRNPDLRSPGV